MQINATAARIFDEFMLTYRGNVLLQGVVINLLDWSKPPSVLFYSAPPLFLWCLFSVYISL